MADEEDHGRYSGTSADLFKTAFDLMVSFKLFLGRFDMRTMQVCRVKGQAALVWAATCAPPTGVAPYVVP